MIMTRERHEHLTRCIIEQLAGEGLSPMMVCAVLTSAFVASLSDVPPAHRFQMIDAHLQIIATLTPAFFTAPPKAPRAP